MKLLSAVAKKTKAAKVRRGSQVSDLDLKMKSAKKQIGNHKSGSLPSKAGPAHKEEGPSTGAGGATGQGNLIGSKSKSKQ
mmetsp:Transcript_39969/g.61163  ORF Transcript_39969/g.61163 Transcript_39969/m.61163 type:complete len:80 (+) Transcript_39969:7577-7816(+)